MAQFARPDSTVTNTGNNTHTAIDETTPSDADFWWGDNNQADELEVGLSNVTDPASSSGHTFRYRVAKTNAGTVDGGGNSVTVTARLMQGGTQIATDTAKTATGTWTQYAFTLSGAEADAITDYTDLRLEFVTSASGGSPANRRGGAVSWAELEVPDAPSGTTLTPASLDHTRAIGTASVTVAEPVVLAQLVVTPTTIADPKQPRQLGSRIIFAAAPAASTLSPASLVHSRALGGPTANPTTSLSGLVHTRALGAASIVASLSPTGLAHTRALGSVIVDTSTLPGSLVHTRALGAPAVSPSLVLAAILHTRSLGAPVVSSITEETLLPAGLSHARALGSPTLLVFLAPAGLAHSRTIGSTSIAGAIGATSLDHARATSSPTLSPETVLAALVHARTLGALLVYDPGSPGDPPYRGRSTWAFALD